MVRVPIKSDPRMYDLLASQLQQYIASNLDWVDHSFGICEKLVNLKEGKRFTSANAFIDKEYVQVMPCEELGNFSFMILRDPQTYISHFQVKSPFSLIFWYNVDKVSSSPSKRNREAVKAQIMATLNGWRNPRIEWGKVYESPENIFSDFSYDHTNNQFLMHPYAGIRIDGTITCNLPCYTPYGSYDESFDYSFDVGHKLVEK